MNRKESTRYVVANERQKATWIRTNRFARYVFYSASIACSTRVLGLGTPRLPHEFSITKSKREQSMFLEEKMPATAVQQLQALEKMD